MKHPRDLRADTAKKKTTSTEKKSRKSVNGTCTYYMVLIQFELVGCRNRTNFLL